MALGSLMFLDKCFSLNLPSNFSNPLPALFMRAPGLPYSGIWVFFPLKSSGKLKEFLLITIWDLLEVETRVGVKS